MSRYDHWFCPCTPLNCEAYVYVVGVPVPVEEDDTVTAQVCEVLPSVPVMVALPAVPAVTVKDALELPLATVTLEGTDATALSDEESEMAVLAVTAELMLAVNVWVLPGARDMVEGVRDVKVGVVVPPDPGAPAEAMYKWSR